jgi:hypothetical protein
MSDPYRSAGSNRDRNGRGMMWGVMAVLALLIIGVLMYSYGNSGLNSASTSPNAPGGTATTGSGTTGSATTGSGSTGSGATAPAGGGTAGSAGGSR